MISAWKQDLKVTTKGEVALSDEGGGKVVSERSEGAVQPWWALPPPGKVALRTCLFEHLGWVSETHSLQDALPLSPLCCPASIWGGGTLAVGCALGGESHRKFSDKS